MDSVGPDATAGARCAAHPARPAHDLCPTCGRPRCTVDARDRGDRCAVCLQDVVRARRVRPLLAAVVGAAAIATFLCVVGAALGQEYVGARFFSWVFPALVGIVIAALAVAWTGPLHRTGRLAVALVSATYAAVSALLDFRFTDEPFGPAGRWLPPLVAAAAAGGLAVLALARAAPPATPADREAQSVVRTGTPSR